MFVFFYRIAELMFEKLIQRMIKIFHFYPVQKQETSWNFIGQSGATFYNRINAIYQ